MRDSAGVRIVESSSSLWGDSTPWRIGQEAAVTIGVLEGAPEQELYRVLDALRLPNGNVVVVNGGTQEVRFYDSAGRHLRSIGGEGEGPGEFRAIQSVELTGDSLLVFDRALERITVLDTVGTLVGSFRLTPTGNEVHPLRLYGLAGLAGQRGMFMAPELFPADMRPEPVVYWDTLPNLLYSWSGELLDSISVSGMDTYSTPTRSGDLKFGRFTRQDVHDGTLYLGHGTRFEIEVYDASGRLRRLIRRTVGPLAVTESDRQRFRTAMLERMSVSAAEMPEFERSLAAIEFAETKPAYGDIVVDVGGHLWVQAYGPYWEGTPTEWLAFDPDGRWLGSITLPLGMNVHEIGSDYILGDWSDEAGVERVALFRLNRDGTTQ